MTEKITCISASNVHNARQNSASTRTCELVRDLLTAEMGQNADVEIVRLLDYELTPCRMCGNCYITGECEIDADFNQIFTKLKASQAVFVVCPHYAPFPSKLMMLLEKLQEIAYLNYCANPDYRFPLAGKPIGIIAHGGQGEEAVPYYQKALLEPLANTFDGLQMRVIGSDASSPHGAAFGIRSIAAQTDSVFVKIEHDWDMIRQRITPLVKNVIAALQEKAIAQT